MKNSISNSSAFRDVVVCIHNETRILTYKTSALHILFIIYFHGVRADEREFTETCWEGHERALEFLGGVPEPDQLRQQRGPGLSGAGGRPAEVYRRLSKAAKPLPVS
jgi:hypothetical protein